MVELVSVVIASDLFLLIGVLEACDQQSPREATSIKISE
jgi:hypothetical protein